MQTNFLHQNPEQIYSQMDAMELTPSVASLSSSQKRNQSQNTFNDNSQQEKNLQPKFLIKPQFINSNFGQNEGNQSAQMGKNKDFVTMGDGSKILQPNDYSDQFTAQNKDNNIHIIDKYQYGHDFSLADRIEGASQQSRSIQSATISLSQLQAQFDLKASSQNQSDQNTPILSIRDEQNAASGYFGEQKKRENSIQSNQNLNQINLNQIESEEQLLDEQYRQLSLNQRAPYRIPVSRQSGSLTSSQRQQNQNFMNSQRSEQMNQDYKQKGNNYNEKVTLFKKENSGSIQNSKSRSLTVSERSGSYPSQRNNYQIINNDSNQISHSKQTGQPNTASYQSLINRNTSPFNRRISTSENDPSAIQIYKGNQMDGGQQKININQHETQVLDSHMRSQSKNSDDSLNNLLQAQGVCNQENYVRLQNKVNDQAKRLIHLQNLLKNSQNQKATILQNQELKKLEQLLKEKDQIIYNLQERNMEIQKGYLSQQDVHQRLFTAEQNLKRETSLNEEQRAQIAILKEGLEQNLERLGINFSFQNQFGENAQNQSFKQIDGYLQLIKFAQTIEKQKNEILTLRDQVLVFDEKLQRSLLDLEKKKNDEINAMDRDFQNQLKSKEALIEFHQIDKRSLQEDKEQLLDFVEKNLQKSKQMQTEIDNLSYQKDKLASENQQQLLKLEESIKSKKDLNELLDQVKNNLVDMRTEKENLSNELVQLKQSYEILEQQFKFKESLLQDLKIGDEKQKLNLKDQEKKILDVQLQKVKQLEAKDQELKDLRIKMRDYENSIEQKDALLEKFRLQIQQLKSQIDNQDKEKSELKQKLKQTQNELSMISETHNKIQKQKNINSQDLLKLTAEIMEHKQELINKKQLISEYQKRILEKDIEIQSNQAKIASSVSDHLENERQFAKDLKIREEDYTKLQKKFKDLEDQLQEKQIKVDYLEKFRNDQKEQEKHLKKTIEFKQQAYEDACKEMRNNKTYFEKQSQNLENTLNSQVQNKSYRELELTKNIEKLENEIRDLRINKEAVENQLNMKLELEKSQMDNSRFQFDFTNIENELNFERQKVLQLTKEVEKQIVERQIDKIQSKKLNEQCQEICKAFDDIIFKTDKFAQKLQKINDLEKSYPHLQQLQKQIVLTKNKRDMNLIRENLIKFGECQNLILKQLKELILEKEKVKEDTVSFEQQLDLIQKDKIPERQISCSNYHSDQKLASYHQEERIFEVEQQMQIEKHQKQNLDACLQKVSQLLNLKHEFRRIIIDYMQHMKVQYQYKMESKNICQKMKQQEQRYNQLQSNYLDKSSKQSCNKQMYSNELIQLKSNIERDRLQLSHLDKKIEMKDQDCAKTLNELVKLDQSKDFMEHNDSSIIKQLKEQVFELKSNLQEILTQKDWAQAKLQEIQFQQDQFDKNEGFSNKRLSRISSQKNVQSNFSQNAYELLDQHSLRKNYFIPRKQRNRIQIQKQSYEPKLNLHESEKLSRRESPRKTEIFQRASSQVSNIENLEDPNQKISLVEGVSNFSKKYLQQQKERSHSREKSDFYLQSSQPQLEYDRMKSQSIDRDKGDIQSGTNKFGNVLRMKNNFFKEIQQVQEQKPFLPGETTLQLLNDQNSGIHARKDTEISVRNIFMEKLKMNKNVFNDTDSLKQSSEDAPQVQVFQKNHSLTKNEKYNSNPISPYQKYSNREIYNQSNQNQIHSDLMSDSIKLHCSNQINSQVKLSKFDQNQDNLRDSLEHYHKIEKKKVSINFKNSHNFKQDTQNDYDYKESQLSKKNINQIINEKSSSCKSQSEFLLKTKGNHLLPLQQNPLSYVNSNQNISVQKNTDNLNSLMNNQSYVFTNESRLTLNKLDLIEQKQMARLLSPSLQAIQTCSNENSTLDQQLSHRNDEIHYIASSSMRKLKKKQFISQQAESPSKI